MKSSNVYTVYSRLLVFSLSISLLCVQTALASAVRAKSVAAAEITVAGPGDGAEKAFVVVNGERAFSGRTFFSGGTISTTETSSATLSLGRLGRIKLAPSSSLSLSFSEGQIAGTLSKGNASVESMEGVSVKIDTPGDSVTNEGISSSRFTVAVVGDRTDVSVLSGTVRYHNGEVMLKDDDDDDDDDDDYWKVWALVGIIGGAIAVVVLLNRDDDTESPVR